MADGHAHSHGLVHDSIKRSRAGVRAVVLALVVLGLTAAAQAVIYVASGSVALLADLIHNAGDAATAIPLGIAFVLRSERGERLAGLAVVAAIFVSACVAGFEAIDRLVHPQDVDALGALALGGRARLRRQLRGGDRSARAPAGAWTARRSSPTATTRAPTPTCRWGSSPRPSVVALGAPVADPLIGLAITLIILRITWRSWGTVRGHDHHHHR